MYPLFLAVRYARSRAVTYLALVTVALSVCSFVVVMGVLGGFRHKAEDIITKIGAPLEVSCDSTAGIPEASELAAEIDDIPGVRGASPYAQTMVLVHTQRFRTTAGVRGVDLEKEIQHGAISEYLLDHLPDAGEDLPKAGRPEEENRQTLRELGHTLFPGLVAAPEVHEPTKTAAPPVTSFRVPEWMHKYEIPKDELEDYEKAPPEDEGKPGEPGTMPIWGQAKPVGDKTPAASDAAGDPDSGRPLPPPPPPPKIKKRPAPREEPIPRGAIVGVTRANKLMLRLGEEIRLTTQGDDQQPRSRSFFVVGFYQTKTQWLDDFIFIDHRAAQDLMGSPNSNGIFIWLEDPKGAERLQPRVASVVTDAVGFRSDIRVNTIRNSRGNEENINMLEVQDKVMMIILLTLCGLNGVFIMAILWVMVSDKTRDIGTVRALGAGRFGVVATFVMLGMTIGLLGVVLGLTGGFVITEHVNAVTDALDAALTQLHLPPLFGGISASLFGMNGLPVFYDPVHIVSVVVVTVVMSLLASLAPAWRAARLDPVEALRHD